MKYIISIFYSIDFWTNFLSSLISSALIALISFYIINTFTPLFNRPDLKMIVKQDGIYRDTILLSENKNGDYEATFHFAIKNMGNKSIKSGEGYWHTYIKDENSSSPFGAFGEKNHQRGSINGSIYPGSFFDLGVAWNFIIKKEDLPNAEVPYFFSTDYGYFPSIIKLDKTTGEVNKKDMYKIGYEIKK